MIHRSARCSVSFRRRGKAPLFSLVAPRLGTLVRLSLLIAVIELPLGWINAQPAKSNT